MRLGEFFFFSILFLVFFFFFSFLFFSFSLCLWPLILWFCEFTFYDSVVSVISKGLVGLVMR